MAAPNTFVAKLISWNAAALVLRLMLFAVFFYHGGQKMFGWFGGHGWAAAVGGFEKAGIPAPLAMAIPITEFVGACCILVGLLARFWAAGHAIIMINAIILVHSHDPWNTMNPTISFPLAVLAIALAVFLGGPGRYAFADFEGRLLGLPRST